MQIGAVITAGGLGKRLCGEIPKQLVKLQGKVMWRHSVETFLNNKNIKALVLTVPKDFEVLFTNETKDLPIIIAVGGKERWQSVKNGIEALPTGISHVMVHDAARPFIDENIINAVADNLAENCCLVAKKVFDTVKVAENFFVKNTLNRDTIWLAQTPQAAPVDLLKELYKKMQNFPDFNPTDEASILEKFNIPIKIIEGNARNDKITIKEDIKKAEKML